MADKRYELNDKAGLLYVLETIKAKVKGWLEGYAKKEDLDSITVETDDGLSDTSTNPVQNRVIKQALDSKAPLASPEFTGTPKAPLAITGSNDMQIANTAFVHQAVNDALGDITQFKKEVVDSLPETGEENVFYYAPADDPEEGNVYDEWVYENGAWERIGSTKMDLTGYLKEDQIVPITEEEIDAMFADW